MFLRSAFLFMGIGASRLAGSLPSVSAMSAAAHTAVREGAHVATLAGGCFWCIESVYSRMKGVHAAISGYTAGRDPSPTYESVCTGSTGHAEAVQITYNPDEISYEKILDIFFTIHDPTQLNRQGNDVGTQYRSGIYYHTPEQLEIAKESIKRIAPEFKAPIVTEVAPATTFYLAEDYHQRYYDKNPDAGYCRAVVRHKVQKAERKFTDQLK